MALTRKFLKAMGIEEEKVDQIIEAHAEAEDGVAFMVEASKKYLALCHERGLVPKFSQFLVKNADGSYSLAEDAQNYWKMLVDRKMVDHTTGKIIVQKAVVPRFNVDTMLDILKNEVESPAAKEAREAEEIVVNNILNDKSPFTKKERAQAKAIMDATIRMAIENSAGEVTVENSGENAAGEVTGEQSEKQLERRGLSSEAADFRNDIDRWNADDRPNGETFILGSTGDVLQGLGAVESDVYMLSDKINTIMREHPEMTIKEIKSIPEILENPVLILASKNTKSVGNNTRLTIFGMPKAQNGKPIMAVFDLHPKEKGIYLSDMQKVASAYTKDNSPRAAMNFIRSSEVLYADKEKTASLLHTVGFLSAEGARAYRIEQSGYIGNITYEDDVVNISGKSFSEVFPEIDAENTVQQQRRTRIYSDREVLQFAADIVDTRSLTDGERDALRIFNERLDNLNELNERLEEQRRIYAEQKAAETPDEGEMRKTLNRLQVLGKKVKAAENLVLSIENKPVFKKILKEARNVVEHEQRSIRDDKADREKYRKQIQETVKTLSEWLLKNSDKEHVPEILKAPVAGLLANIDLDSARIVFGKSKPTRADKKFAEMVVRLHELVEHQQSKIEDDGRSDIENTGAYLDLSEENREKTLEIARYLNDFKGFSLVTQRGFEPRTHCLKGSCSAC